jgi:hypothetical protein
MVPEMHESESREVGMVVEQSFLHEACYTEAGLWIA